jgi:hypothetical protein
MGNLMIQGIGLYFALDSLWSDKDIVPGRPTILFTISGLVYLAFMVMYNAQLRFRLRRDEESETQKKRKPPPDDDAPVGALVRRLAMPGPGRPGCLGLATR